MMDDTLQSEVEALIERALRALSLVLWGCHWAQQAQGTLLSIYIDKDGGVLLGDCVQATRQIQAIFHVHFPEDLPFSWEVKSPGAARILLQREHFNAAVGQPIVCRVKKNNQEGTNPRSGELQTVDDQGLTLKYASGALGHLSWQAIAYARIDRRRQA